MMRNPLARKRLVRERSLGGDKRLTLPGCCCCCSCKSGESLERNHHEDIILERQREEKLFPLQKAAANKFIHCFPRLHYFFSLGKLSALLSTRIVCSLITKPRKGRSVTELEKRWGENYNRAAAAVVSAVKWSCKLVPLRGKTDKTDCLMLIVSGAGWAAGGGPSCRCDCRHNGPTRFSRHCRASQLSATSQRLVST